MKVSLLTIGTEIITGEILNTNVKWLSERLESLGLEITHHLTVPDSWELMMGALDYLSSSNLLVLTGGLGPTRDDLTRDVVARWSQRDLEFSEECWKDLVQKLESRGRTPRDSHKRQCYFPQGSVLLENSVGTAHGFLLKSSSHQWVVLPGPPKELQPMWLHHVEPNLPQGTLTPWVKWQIFGLPESEVAERFERALSEFCNIEHVEIGYRASPPVIHVKMRKHLIPKGFEERIQKEFSENWKAAE